MYLFSSSVTCGVQSLHCFEMSRFTPGSHLKTCCFPFKVKFFYPFSSSKINCIVFGRPCFNSGQPVVYHQSPCTEGIKGSLVLVGSALNRAKLYNCLNNRIVAVLTLLDLIFMLLSGIQLIIFDCGSESRVSRLIPGSSSLHSNVFVGSFYGNPPGSQVLSPECVGLVVKRALGAPLQSKMRHKCRFILPFPLTFNLLLYLFPNFKMR